MSKGSPRERLLREEKGFTLSETLVTMVIMIVVLSALYNIFDMSIRVFSFGNDKVEAAENARLGLEKMAREIRAAYPVNKAAGDNRVITSPIPPPDPSNGNRVTSSEITFGNDLNGNRLASDPGEQITYRLSGGSLLRNGQPTVEFAKANGLTFEYLGTKGCSAGTLLCPQSSEPDISVVRIRLDIEIDRGSFGKRTQTLTTDVALRNRGN